MTGAPGKNKKIDDVVVDDDDDDGVSYKCSSA
jgi:hypothetical protein